MEIVDSVSARNKKAIAGIDIGGTKIAIGIVDGRGEVLLRGETQIQVEKGPENALTRIVEILKAQTQQTGLAIGGIGIGCTGPVDPITGELGDVNTLPNWQGWNPVVGLSEALGVSAALENDADAAALGEARWGAGRGKGSLISITVGTGIGAGIIPKTLDLSLVDRVEQVSNDEAVEFARRLTREEGILSGISCGAAAAVAVRLGKMPEFEGKTIVTILPDAAERYLSTLLFEGISDE